MDRNTLFTSLLIPALFVAGGLFLGVIFEKIVLKKLRDIVRRTSWGGDTIFLDALRGMTLLWFALAGLYWALESAEWRPSYVRFIDTALLAIAIFSATVVAARILSALVDVYSKRVGGIFVRTTMVTILTQVIVYIVGILVILQTVGISIAPLLTALGVGGLAVALGLQDTLSNLFAGITIMVSKQVRPGDYVRLDSAQEGTITDITWRYTTIATTTANMVIIPNSKLASAIVTNYHLPEDVTLLAIKVRVGYGSDLERVEEVTLEVARQVCREVRGGVPDSTPSVRYNRLGDFGIEFNVNIHVDTYVDQFYLTHEFLKRLHRRYREEGIAIPFPTQTLHLQ
jgi:small-conductance mechanosensitive channel